ncbi:MAG: bifunctional DNA-formamidopyrimidine glycosylase/DNA-(apurinic or apyrimidinic site) lyase [Phycisphaerae bacterium]|nr:bifunctional DNA-formamidopyrimidine glycosylase/DNA-(apurinic or apyrimidinic site) lyase [Phycisphaerae bacterium]
MPELPEVERVVRSLRPHALGAVVHAVRLLRRDICEGPSTPADLLEGDSIAAVSRRGKLMSIHGRSGRVLCVHLGMTGQLTIRNEAPDPRRETHVHAVWTLARARVVRWLVFRDPRRFGGLWTFPSAERFVAERLGELGPDALETTAARLSDRLRGSRRAVKAALLDQSVLAGVGNIYADEALFEARIRPTRPAARLRAPEFDALARSVRAVLARAIEAGGSTLRDYLDADGKPGGAARLHRVYGRAGQPCVACAGALKSATVAQRTTVWCPRCQK